MTGLLGLVLFANPLHADTSYGITAGISNSGNIVLGHKIKTEKRIGKTAAITADFSLLGEQNTSIESRVGTALETTLGKLNFGTGIGYNAMLLNPETEENLESQHYPDITFSLSYPLTNSTEIVGEFQKRINSEATSRSIACLRINF